MMKVSRANTAAILSFILAENLGGNGVLAVTTMGLFVGNMIVKEKGSITEFASLFSLMLELLVFVLLGLVIEIRPGALPGAAREPERHAHAPRDRGEGDGPPYAVHAPEPAQPPGQGDP